MAQPNALIDFDLIDQISKLIWARTGNSEMAEKLMMAKFVGDVWQRFSSEQEMEVLRTQAIMRISKYVKEHPKASKEELATEIGKHITEFAKQVERM